MESEFVSGVANIPAIVEAMPPIPMPTMPKWGEGVAAGSVLSFLAFVFWYFAKVYIRKIAEENVNINGQRAFDSVIDNLRGEIQRLTEKNSELHEKIDKLLNEVSTLRIENASLKADLYRLSSIIKSNDDEQIRQGAS